MTLTQVFPAVPETWSGSTPEWAIYWALRTMGLKPDVDFVYQSAQMGGRMEKGGAVIDFLFFNPPNLGINVQSIYFHYTGQQRRGQIQRAQLEAIGIRMIFIDEADALRDPKYYVAEALMFRDHSLMAGR